MEKVKLGRTGLDVTRLSLGGLFMSDLTGDFEQSKQATLHALRTGANYIDTAPSYFNSETCLGNILKDWEGEYPIISTKIGMPKPFDPKSKKDVIESVEKSMENLHADHIDILFVHEPERTGLFDWWDNELTCEGPVIEALDEMKKNGMIKYTGVGGTCTHELARVCDTGKFDVVLTAFNYSLLWREAQYEILPVAKKHNMGVVSGSPLQQGALAVRRDDIITNGAPWISEPRRAQYKELYKLLDETGMDIIEMSMRFVVSNPLIHCILTGSRSINEFDGNGASVEKGSLPADILKRLDDIYSMVPFRPTLEPFILPFGEEHKKIGELI
ncbi:D-threo-aldose 1-dehydrogenase [Aequitasia blattaphilus]|uniref:Aldo/keto reductase n=1 Tax=Aequitasia blattaphilus TaxID=2949332 RepID=A0ABT1EDU8_9FIRM|nr:aldo/keto reductase [Aequitasia blattaphilus]MCP1103011.1 aldo/keto reductase [Aequitasia blattaphilus]MCR8615651.1 aldo/keto reductase [Aequitasia blattaphilus]